MDNVFRSQFRLPGDLYDRLIKATDKSGRSLNAEVVHRLEMSFESSPDVALVEEWADRWSRPEHKEELRAVLSALFKIAGPPRKPD